MEQRTDEWFSARLGKVTASRVSDVVAKTKTGYGATRGNYMSQLIVERLTGKQAESFSSSAMQWGTDTEPLARAAYETFKDVLVDEEGFVQHPTIEMAGASPDGLIGDDGLVEIKSPNTATHIETLIAKKADARYINQMQWQMACTGRKWCDFVSFDPRMPEDLQLFVTRVERDDEKIAELEAAVIEFLNEVDQKIATLKGEK
jgi:putative phage-type endonuclease